MNETKNRDDVVDFDWKRETKKHIFILNSSGKPMFSRKQDVEQELVNLCGILQAVVSITRDTEDEIVSLKAGSRKTVYFIKRDLYFVCISSTNEPEAVLLRQLQFMYSQILLMMTAAVHDRNAHDVLGQETCQLLLSTCHEDVLPFSLALQAIPVVPMPTLLRKELLKRLTECVNSSNAV